MLALRTLGHLRLIGPQGELLRGRRKELVLLAYLARRMPKPVTRAELAALLWGERPEANARQSLRQALLNLKRVVDGVEIETEAVALPASALEFDVAAFERDLAAGSLEGAVGRWDGDFLADAEDAGGETYRAWMETERQALRARLAWALEQLAEQAMQRGEPDPAARWAERWSEAFPLEERPQVRLIEALQRAGRAGEALARHAAFLARVRQELGTEPSAEFLRLAATPTRESTRPRRTPGSTALFTPDFVGRTAALGELAATWRAARAGTATLVLIEGEAGMGKTRLCEEFLRSLADQGDHLVLRARVRPEDPDDTVSALRQLGTALAQAPGVGGAPAGALRTLTRLAPALRERFPQLPDADGLAWANDEALAQVLGAVAGEQPVVVFLDDVASGARDLIASLVERLRDAAILVIATGEPAQLAPLHGLYGARPIRLHPLGRSDLESLVRSMLTLKPDDLSLLVGRLESETGGQPLYVVETLRALLDEGELVPDAGGVWRAAQPLEGRPLPLPNSVREAFARRLAFLSEASRRLIEAAATLAAPAEVELLRATAGLSEAELHAALEELLGRRLLRETSTPPGEYSFTHELGRRAAYEALPPARRRTLHRAALQSVRALRPADVAALAYHRQRAGSGTWQRSTAGLRALAGQGDPVRVAGLFGVGAALVLALVFALLIQLGLPDWVFTASVALLAIGLPIMVATGLEERRRARASATTGQTVGPAGPARHLTWRNALLGGGLAFCSLALVTGGYMAMRLLGIGPLGTLVASGVLDPRDQIILADFLNRTTDSTLGPSVTEALRVDLTQSRVVRLVDRSAIADALRRMERPTGTPVDLAVAREIAQREGGKAIVSGEIGPVGNGYVLSAGVLSPEDGRELVAVRETAGNDAALISAIDRLSARLRERIGESLKAIRATPPLFRVTTASLPALKKYSEGLRAFNVGEVERALAQFQAAVAIDTTFASAYRSIAVILYNTRAEPSRILAAATRAFRYRDRLPDIERYLATAWYYTTVNPNLDSVSAAYLAVLEIDSLQLVALTNLASGLTGARDWARAEAYARRVVEHERMPPSPTYYTLADALVGQGKFAAAESVIAHFATQQPNAPQPVWFRALLATAREDFSAARPVFQSVLDRFKTSRLWRFRAEYPLAMLDELEGRVGSAERRIAGLMELSARERSARDYFQAVIPLGWLDLRYHSRPAAALGRLNAALEKFPLSALPPEDRPLLELAEQHAAAGRPDRARQFLAEWEATNSPQIRQATSLRHEVAGEIALAEGRYQDAITAYRARSAAYQLLAGEWCNPCGLFDLARVYDLAGQPDSAVAAYERALSTKNLPWLYGGAGHYLAQAYRRLGELYQRQGEPERAAEYYNRFIELWKNADPELQPAVRNARQRLAAVMRDRATLASASHGPAASNSVAVLYFDNLSRDTADAYLAEGFTDEITARLGQVERLMVKSRTAARRYRGAGLAPAALGQALGAAYLVNGTVRRGAGHLRVTVELVGARDGSRLWGQQYDRAETDLLAIQEDIAVRVATAIAGRLLPGEETSLSQPPTRSAEGYDHFIRGNYFLSQRNPRSVLRAIDEYQAATRSDPTFSRAFARIAVGYALFPDWGWEFPGLPPDSVLARASRAADRALRFDSSTSDSWMARAYVLERRTQGLAGVTEAFDRAITLDPKNAEAYHQYGPILVALGRDSAAAAMYQRALQLDPYRSITLLQLGALRAIQGKYQEAVRWLDSALSVDPGFGYGYALRAMYRLLLGQNAAAREDAETSVRLQTGLPAAVALAAAEARVGDTERARARLDSLLRTRTAPAAPTATDGLFLSWGLLAVNDLNRAVQVLEQVRPRQWDLWYYLRQPGFDRLRGDSRYQRLVEQVRPVAEPPPATNAVGAQNRVAVLYFDNLSRDTTDAYLADGLTEELITRLGRVEQLTMKSRGAVQRYRGVTADPAVLGPALNVAYLVSGSTRRSGGRIRVAVELVRTADGVRIWGDAFDRPNGDLLAIEDDIAQAVATNVAGRLVPRDAARLATRPTRSAEAYDHFLRGNYELAKRDPAAVARAIGQYGAAVRLDPQFAEAYARMALGYGFFPDWGWTYPGLERDSVLARGAAAAQRALAIQPTSSDAWLADAYLRTFRYPRTFEGVKASFERAVALDPKNAEALHQYASALQLLGEDSAEVAAFKRALALEPDRAITLHELGMGWYLQRRYREALQCADSALSLNHGLVQAYRLRALIRVELGNPAAARADMATVLGMNAGDARDQTLLSIVEAREGNRAAARARLDRVMATLRDSSHIDFVKAGYLGAALAAVGDSSAALDVLQRTPTHDLHLWFFLRWPSYDLLRSNLRFRRLVDESAPGRGAKLR